LGPCENQPKGSGRKDLLQGQVQTEREIRRRAVLHEEWGNLKRKKKKKVRPTGPGE